MVIEDDMEYLQVYVGATSISMHERFTVLAATSPFRGAGPRRARRLSTNDGPLLTQSKNPRNQNIIDEVVQHLGLDWRVQDLQQQNYQRASSQPRSRAGSQPRSRAGSMSRYSSESSLPGLIRSNSWGNINRANSVSNFSQRSGQSRRSSGEFSDTSRSVKFSRQPALNLDMRLQMRNAWMRGRRGRWRGRGRGRGQGGVQRGRIYRNNWQQTRGQRGNRRRNYRNRGNQPYGIITRSRAQNNSQQYRLQQYNGQQNGGNAWKNPARGSHTGRGRGRGRGGAQRGGVSQNGMPPLKTLAQLDKELEEYMASTPASLDKQLEEYMAQNGMEFDL